MTLSGDLVAEDGGRGSNVERVGARGHRYGECDVAGLGYEGP